MSRAAPDVEAYKMVLYDGPREPARTQHHLTLPDRSGQIGVDRVDRQGGPS
jgi:hypothetical protein